jgi:hypothetical protein
MPDYDFRSLSSHDFELLVRDLLQEERKVRLERFSPGRDGGIDFRFKNITGDLVVQCSVSCSERSTNATIKRASTPAVGGGTFAESYASAA